MSKRSKKPVAEPQELPDDIEIIGPGQMLAEGREALSLSQEDVAERLNFRLTLVKDIENEKFDKSLPDTFNRGYLRNFAKLVNVSVEDVLASYEMLNVAEKQSAEMQSFSKRTKRQAENSRLKWITYLIVAMILGSTIVWYFQTPISVNTLANPADNPKPNESLAAEKQSTSIENNLSNELSDTTGASIASEPAVVNSELETVDETGYSEEVSQASLTSTASEIIEQNEAAETSQSQDAIQEVTKTPVVFTFSGDCWVNIYDATGERIAWGVKKSGYVMKIEGVSPFSITLGKPELVAINFAGDNIDMKQFNRGNIAKFSLPLAVN